MLLVSLKCPCPQKSRQGEKVSCGLNVGQAGALMAPTGMRAASRPSEPTPPHLVPSTAPPSPGAGDGGSHSV